MPTATTTLEDISTSGPHDDIIVREPEAVISLLRSAADPGQRLAIVGRLFGEAAVFTTSFGLEDQMITHLVCTLKLPIDIVTLDTGRLFPSTYGLWEETEGRYGRRIRAVHPDPVRLGAYLADCGINGFYHSLAARHSCCEARKVEPLSRALEGAAAWVTGLRADQSDQRLATPVASFDGDRHLLKVSPLADWSREDVQAFCDTEGVPLNPLHKQNYLSIGCEPCTRAVRAGESERSGRWWWEQEGSSECGLHGPRDGQHGRQGQ